MNFLRRLFNKKSISNGILPIEIFLHIPDSYYSNPEILEEILNYQKQYEKLLKESKCLTSIELEINNLKNDANMLTTLIMHTILKSENDIQSKVKLEILKSRLDDLLKMTIERYLSLEALNKNPKYIFSITKKVSIKNELNNLGGLIVALESEKKAISLEIESFLKLVKEAEKEELTPESDLWWQLIDFDDIKYQKVKDDAKKYIPDVYSEIEKMDLHPREFLAILEIELEIYAYKNKFKKESLKEYLNKICKSELNHDTKASLLEKIKQVEAYYLLFYDYGIDIVSAEDLMYLYELKFNITTFDNINNPIDYSRNVDMGSVEYSCYKKIIERKIEDLVMGRDGYLYDYYKGDTPEVIELIMSHFKVNGKIRTTILTDRDRLALLLACEEQDGILKYLNQYKVKLSKEYLKNLDDTQSVKFADTLTMKDYYELLSLKEERTNENDFGFYKEPFIDKIRRLTLRNNPDVYYMPEGLIEIDAAYDDTTVVKRLKEKMNGKRVVCPKSLRKIYGNLLEGIEIKGLILNEELEHIDYELVVANHDKFTIPYNFPKALERSMEEYKILWARKKIEEKYTREKTK